MGTTWDKSACEGLGMLYIFAGSDEMKVREKALQWVAASRKKAPDALYVHVEAGVLSEHQLEDIIATQGLFYQKMLVVLDDPMETDEGRDLIEKYVDAIANSNNVIAFIMPKLLLKDKGIVTKATKVFEFNKTAKAEVRGFNSSLVNALSAKNSIALWQEVTLALRRGEAPEAVHGLLAWKARDMLAKGASKWSREELRTLSRTLLTLVGDARRGDGSVETSLELFALTLK